MDDATVLRAVAQITGSIAALESVVLELLAGEISRLSDPVTACSNYFQRHQTALREIDATSPNDEADPMLLTAHSLAAGSAALRRMEVKVRLILAQGLGS